MSVRSPVRVFLYLLLASGAAATASAADDAREWLARMNDALTARNYDGVFFHVHGGRVETMRIIHRVQGGNVMERLVSLDGSGREFVRTGTELVCYLPDKRTVLVERRPENTTLLGNLPRFDETTEGYYELKHVERARLMGRDTRVIAVLPKDDFRYGYRLWIDEATTMPLKTQLCDARGRVIEQIQFANLSLPREIADSEFEPQVDTAGFKWLRQDAQDPRLAQSGSSVVWRAMRLPPGFRMTLRSAQSMPGAAGPVEHLVFSDGLASVSVFVESTAPGKAPMSGPARVGSSSAFSTTVSGHQVTAVGEVPPETVRVIASSLQADDKNPVAGKPPAPGLSLGAQPKR
ncbi:MAG TPA: MucB/RseB C-terminal domain-containing protein [Steroidobacteraceae bacterium]|nr:MucB/RseB C-terminal domain-containing protein [Steroidobacteraceae bacterium]